MNKKRQLKKKFFFFYWCLFSSLFIVCSTGRLDIYKSEEIPLIPDIQFGNKTDWDDPKLYKLSTISISNEGEIFAAISKQHKIVKFNKNGKVLFSFGQKGQGPSDLIYPSNISILDNNYLIVCDYPLNRKISFFDLNGKYIKIISTSYPVYNVISLKNNKIAIQTQSISKKTKTTIIYIKDILNNKEIKIAKRVDTLHYIGNSNNILVDPQLQGDAFIGKTLEGNLILGFSYDKNIRIFSPEGMMIKSFKLKTETVKVDDTIINKYKKNRIQTIKEIFPKPKKLLKDFLKVSNQLNKLFFDHLPFYSTILIDNHDNILVFDFTLSHSIESFKFQVYTPNGEYICDSSWNLKPLNCTLKPYDFKKDIWEFYKNSLYLVLDERGDNDIQRKIIKINPGLVLVNL